MYELLFIVHVLFIPLAILSDNWTPLLTSPAVASGQFKKCKDCSIVFLSPKTSPMWGKMPFRVLAPLNPTHPTPLAFSQASLPPSRVKNHVSPGGTATHVITNDSHITLQGGRPRSHDTGRFWHLQRHVPRLRLFHSKPAADMKRLSERGSSGAQGLLQRTQAGGAGYVTSVCLTTAEKLHAATQMQWLI